MRFYNQLKLIKYFRRLHKRRRRKEKEMLENILKSENKGLTEDDNHCSEVDPGKKVHTGTPDCGCKKPVYCTMGIIVKNISDFVVLSNFCLRTEASKHRVCKNIKNQKLIVMEELWNHYLKFHLNEIDTEWMDVEMGREKKCSEENTEPGLVLGVAALRKEEANLDDLILQHEATGKYQDDLCCYERQGKTVRDANVNLGIIQSYLSIDQPATAVNLAAGLVAKQPGADLTPIQTEAAWQLGMWENLDKYTSSEGDQGEEMGWLLGLGKIMLDVKREQWGAMNQVLARLTGELVEPLSAGTLEQGAYHRGYTNINKLSMLCKVEKMTDRFLFTSKRVLAASTMGATELLSKISYRLSYTQSLWTSLDPMFRLRRAVLGFARDRIKPHNSQLADRLQFEIGECWLKSTQVARESGQFQEANSFLLEVKKSKHIKFFLETAKFSWARGNHTESIGALRRGLADIFPQIAAALADEVPEVEKNRLALTVALESMSKGEKDVLCQDKLLLAKYIEEAANVSNATVMATYSEAKSLTKVNDDVFFNSASEYCPRRSSWPFLKGQGLRGGGSSYEEDRSKLTGKGSREENSGNLGKKAQKRLVLDFEQSPNKRRRIVSEYKQRTPRKSPPTNATPTKRKVATPVKMKTSTPMKRKTPRLKCMNLSCRVGFSSHKAKTFHERFQCQFSTPTTCCPTSSLPLEDECVCRICGKDFTTSRSRARHEKDIHSTCTSGTSSLLGSRQSDISDRDDSPASSSG